MKKLLIALTLIFLMIVKMNGFEFILKDGSSSKFNPYDHIVFSYAATTIGSRLLHDMGNKFHIRLLTNRFVSSLISSTIVFTLGYLKEKYLDYSFQKSDINSNMVGITTAFISINLVDLIKINNSKKLDKRRKK